MHFDVNRMNSGRIQIAAHRAPTSNGSVQTYESPKEATEVLLALGYELNAVEEAFATIKEFNYGQYERYSLPEIHVEDQLVRQHGFVI